MDIIGLVILFVIIAIISSVVSAAKKKGGGGEGEPPRRTMSDIQRAFMMMSGDDEEERQAPPARTYAPSPPPPVRPAAPVFGEGSSDYGTPAQRSSEGASNYGSVQSGSMRYDPLPATSEGTSFVSTVSSEGTQFEALAARNVIDDENSTLLQHRLDDSADAADLKKERLQAKMNYRPAIKLFQHQNDYVKAIIYSEILSRRAPGRRAR